MKPLSAALNHYIQAMVNLPRHVHTSSANTRADDKMHLDPKKLDKALKTKGLMEYVSIPWENHSSGDLDNYRELTVNLALWFVHVLAGNSHQVDWKYCLLQNERVIHDMDTSVGSLKDADRDESEEGVPDPSETPDTSSPPRTPHPPLKRKWEDDPITMSFDASRSFNIQVSAKTQECQLLR